MKNLRALATGRDPMYVYQNPVRRGFSCSRLKNENRKKLGGAHKRTYGPPALFWPMNAHATLPHWLAQRLVKSAICLI